MISTNELETVSCPLCAGTGRRVAFSFDPYRVVRCTSCDFHYLSPRPTEAAMMRLYQDDDYFEGGEGGYDAYEDQELALRATFKRLLKTMDHHGLTGGDLLEVGCGYGYLLDEARPWFDRRFGTEFSPRAAEHARPRADDVYLGGCEAVPPGQMFDCVVATQVIEHVYAPETFLCELRDRLKPGGSLMVAAPDMGSFWRKCMGRRWPSFKVPEHVNYFDAGSLGEIMNRAGLSGLETIPYPHAFPMPLVAAKLGVRVPHFLNRHSLWLPKTTIAVAGTRCDD